VIPAPGINWNTIYDGLETIQQIGTPAPEGSLPICVSGRQGEMVLLAKMLRAIETAQTALARSPTQRGTELATVAWKAAQDFFKIHEVDLKEIYPANTKTNPEQQGIAAPRSKSPILGKPS
jgi:hypothetical protein